MAMGRIEHTLLDGEFSVRPNRPKTIACNPTIPQKVTNVSIHDKGPEPESPAPLRVRGYNGLSLDASRSLTCSGISTLPPFRSRNPRKFPSSRNSTPRMRPAPSASRYTPGSSSTVRPTPPSGILPRRQMYRAFASLSYSNLIISLCALLDGQG